MTQGTEYAVVIDDTIDAVYLRDICLREAQKHHERAANATNRHALDRNWEKHRIFAKYADRFEHIRQEEVERFKTTLGATT